MDATRTAVNSPNSLSAEQLHVARRRFCVAVIFFLPILVFTFPGRPVQAGLSGDPLTLIKLAALASALFGGVLLFLLDRASKRMMRSLSVLLPFFAFLTWAILSVLWSPLRSVTLNQAGGLTALLLLTLHLSCAVEAPADASHLLKRLCQSLLVYSGIVFVAFLVNPTFSGLDRSIISEREDGLIHPTAAGSTAAVAMVLTGLCWMSGKFPWASGLVLPAIFIHLPVSYFSHSRSSLVMAMITLAIAAFYFGSRLTRAILALTTAAAALTIILLDPGLHQIAGDNVLIGYLLRGQDISQLAEGSGRAEMWQAIWSEFQSANVWLKGHGYFVTSRTGELYVWYHYANHPAHNIFLQVLVTVGLVGLVTWMIALLRIGVTLFQLRRSDEFRSTYFAILLLSAIWYAGWSIGSTSFMGPVRSESVLWFTMVGLGIGLVGSGDYRQRQAAQS